MNLAASMSLDATNFVGPLRAVRSALSGVTGSISTLGNVGNIFTGITSAMNLAREALGPFNEAIKASGDAEELRTTFKILLGDATLAARAMKEATDFADSTPFEPKPIQEGYKSLLAYGFALEEIKGLMTDAGDLASVMKVDISEVTRVFGRMKSGDFGEAFERLRDFGISKEDLSGEGLVFDKGGSFKGTAQQAMEAVRTIIQTKFGGTMDAVSSTWNGQWSTLVGYINGLLREFGTPITETLKPALAEAINFAKQLGPLAKDIGSSIGPVLREAANDALAIGRGLAAAFQSGEISSLFGLAAQGAARLFLTSLSTGFGTLIQVVGSGLRGVLQSALGLIQQVSFWDGIAASVMSIVYQVRSSLLDAVAGLVEMLPAPMRMGADVAGMRRNSNADVVTGLGYQAMAKNSFAKIDFESVMSPMSAAAGEVASHLQSGLGMLISDFTNIPEFKAIQEKLAGLSQSFAEATEQIRESVSETIEQTSAGKAVEKAENSVRQGRGSFNISDTLSRVGLFVNGRHQNNDQRKTHDLMKMQVDLLKSGVELWRTMNPGAPAKWG